jgi:uncharacterized protein
LRLSETHLIAFQIRNTPMPKLKHLLSALLTITGPAALADTPTFINEIHYDNAGADSDEFVEITGPAGTDLSGWTLVLYNGSASVLSPYATLSLSGSLSDDTGTGYGFTTITYSGIQNGAPDGLALINSAGEVVQFLSYEGSFTPTSGPAAGMTSLDIGVAETASTLLGQSLQLQGSGTLDTDFQWVADIAQTPGEINLGQSLNGSDPGDSGNDDPEIDPVAIYDIQGAGHYSPYEGQTVTTEGIVTAVETNGVYVQDPQGDANEATSDALYVYTSGNHGLQSGDAVRITGSISEYVPGGSSSGNLSLTEFYRPEITVISQANPLPEAVHIGRSGRIPPSQIIDDDRFSNYDPQQDGIDFYESLEAMRVVIDQAVAISPTNHYDEIFVLADEGADASGRNPRGGITIQPGDFNPERIQIDFNSSMNDLYYAVDTGDLLGDVRGVMNYSYGNFEVYPSEAFAPQSGGLQAETSDLNTHRSSLTIASYNLLNLDPNDQDGDQDLNGGRFAHIAQQIVDNLGAPDILALQEIQDNSGSVDDGVVSADVTLEHLATAIQEAGGPEYLWIDNPPQNNQDGGQPGANIRVAFLYNPRRVSLDPDSVQRLSDTDLSDGDAFQNSRKPLYARFTRNDQTFHLINNHFASKGGSTPLFGSTQPYINGSEEQRTAQAREVNAFVRGLQTDDPEARIVVMGDLNEFHFMSPLKALKGGDNPNLINMTESLSPEQRYTYIYEGNAQALDHMLVSENLARQASYDVVHVNTEFQDYASDHDPVLLKLTLAHPRHSIRFATFNTSLNRANSGELIQDLSTPDNPQAQAVAEIIQRVRPDVLLLNEFDYDKTRRAIRLFQRNYLGKGQNGARAIRYPHYYLAESNTGIPTGYDLDHDGATDGPGDAQGFGTFPGQYGMVLLSRYPIDQRRIRVFQKFLWKEMPENLIPEGWYSEAALENLRLSSKSHWDIPVRVKGREVHVLASHPTPPVFDGEEDRNGRRNHDEIRFWLDYISGADYAYDDKGRHGGLSDKSRFVILGDMNADPRDGDSTNNPLGSLLASPRINTSITPASLGAAEASLRQAGINPSHLGGAAFDTADFADTTPGNLRTDYVLPSINLKLVGAGVYWPVVTDPQFNLVGDWPFPSSDHRLVWIDLLMH